MAAIRENMEVIASDGERVGTVAAVEGGEIRINRADGGDGRSTVPGDWVSRVDEHVHLTHGGAVVRGRWSGTKVRPERTEGRARAPWIIGLVLLVIAVILLIRGCAYMFDGAGRDSGEALPTTQVSLEAPAPARG